MCDVLDRVEARGMEKTRKEMILNMLKENISVDTIARVAKLTADQVIAIGKKAAVLYCAYQDVRKPAFSSDT